MPVGKTEKKLDEVGPTAVIFNATAVAPAGIALPLGPLKSIFKVELGVNVLPA